MRETDAAMRYLDRVVTDAGGIALPSPHGEFQCLDGNEAATRVAFA
ncbi:MAG: hypothetical protein ACRDZ0_15880 [Acidimicrobiales bacterium]